MGLYELLVLRVAHEVRVLGLTRHLLPRGVRRQAVHRAAVLRVGLEHVERLEHGLLEIDSVSLGHETRQRERRQVAAHPHTHRQRLLEAELAKVEHAVGGQPLHAVERPARLVDLATAVVVGLADFVEEHGELVVVLRVNGVAAEATVDVVEARLGAQCELSELVWAQCGHPRLHFGVEEYLRTDVVGVGFQCLLRASCHCADQGTRQGHGVRL
mmetsp:Transcript_1984/g.3103  ORF Transcript_1984/g.3103 Transcript_1984/m.3103 type:complete len:214 (-) Transcript_1984:14-655(-)